MKKKILIGLGIFFGVIIVAIAAAVIYFWPFIQSVDWSIVSASNIKAVYTAFTQDEESLNIKLKEIDDKRAEDIKSQLNMEIRDFTEEEQERIDKGEITKTQLIAQIISESVGNSNTQEIGNGNDEFVAGGVDYSENQDTSGNNVVGGNSENSQNNTGTNNDSSETNKNNTAINNNNGGTSSNSASTNKNNNTSTSNNSSKPSNNSTSNSNSTTNSKPSSGSSSGSSSANKTETSDEIIARHISVLYSYYSEFEGRVNTLASTARNWMHAYKSSNNVTWKEAKVAAMQHFTSQASQIESDCYAKVDAQIAKLRADLIAAGASTDVVNTVADSAYSEMEIKKSQIIQQGMAKMSKD
ncbi:MAG: hypothetical protein ACI3XA_09220 [Clostridia bacterium]